MSGEALTRADAIRARSRRFRDMVGHTYDRLHDTLQQCETPYVALSGGKDSTVVLHMVRSLRPDTPALWFDDELEYDDTAVFVRATGGEPLHIASGKVSHGQWFVPWVDEPYWRNPEPDMLKRHDLRWDHIPAFLGFDGSITGVRGQESTARRIHAITHGDTYEHLARRQIVIQPIIDWSIDDVWAYIAMSDRPYHPVYDAMSAAGIPRDKQRVGPLPLTPRWVLAAVDPTLPARLEARYGRHWG